MEDNFSGPTIYVGNDVESRQALSLLRRSGLDVAIKKAPAHYKVAYGTPVLFGLSNRFEGIFGIRIFVENAKLLGYHPRTYRRNGNSQPDRAALNF